jgi:hypothetical protein
VLLFVIYNLNVPLLPFVANETPLKEIYRVNQIFLISIKVLHTDGVGKVYRHSLPFGVCHHEGEGTRDVMHGAHASGVGFDVFGPFL